MHEIRTWIEVAVKNLALKAEEVPVEIARPLIANLMSRYVVGNPRSWWEDLKKPYRHIGIRGMPLCMLFPNMNNVAYLIAETEEPDLPVYIGTIQELSDLLQDCPLFEYYVAALDESWLVIESDHDEYYLLGRIGVQETGGENADSR